MTTTTPTLSAPAVGSFPDWAGAARQAHRAVPVGSVQAAWRTLTYLCAAQLYLLDNPRLARPLVPEDVKPHPAGHWGVCPPVNYVLAHLGPLTAHRPPGSDLAVLHGAGHAAPSALAHAYLNATLELTGRGAGWSMPDLRALMANWPHPRFGTEITPLIPGVRYTGGQLGPSLAVAQGMVLDAPQRLAVPLIGDGEMETGASAAAWLGRRAFIDTGDHGAVLPIVLANGLKMGGPSLLAGLDQRGLRDYFHGLGYRALITDGTDQHEFRNHLGAALANLRPLGSPDAQPVIVLTMPKGYSGPDHLAGRRLAPGEIHKTPLKNPRENEEEFTALVDWLTSYRPTELLTAQGRPMEAVRQALAGTPPALPAPAPGGVQLAPQQRSTANVSAVVRARAEAGRFRLFSPDEVASNRLDLTGPDGQLPPWAVEVLNEELCHAWLQGYTETGRDALLASYEAFAPVNTSLIVQHLKHRRLRYACGEGGLPSINYLLTSLGWNNTYTHQNPSLAGSLLDLEDGSIRIYTPADATRAAAVLATMLASSDRTNLLITDKHPGPTYYPAPFRDELTRGAAVWPRHSWGRGTPNLVLASAGDIPAREMTSAAETLHQRHPDATVRYVHINDLAVLGTRHRPHALTARDFAHLFGQDCPVLLAAPIYPAPVLALLAQRPDPARFNVLGYQDPGRPRSPAELLEESGLSAPALSARATALLKDHRR